METEGIGQRYGGTAIGLVFVFSNLCNLLAPPTGNSLAALNVGLPFVFWTGLTLAGAVGLVLAQEKR